VDRSSNQYDDNSHPQTSPIPKFDTLMPGHTVLIQTRLEYESISLFKVCSMSLFSIL
jgi:hypothetical protein